MKTTVKALPVIVSPVFLNGAAVMRAFGRMGAHCVAVSSDPKVVGFASRFAYEKVLLPNCGDAPGAFSEWLLSRRDLYGGLVIPTGDEVLAELHFHREELSQDFQLCIPPERACEIALDKASLAEVCRQAAIPTPATVRLGAATDLHDAGGLGFPVAVKPCYGIDFQRVYSGKLALAGTPDHLREISSGLARRGFAAVLQQLIPSQGPVCAYSAYVARSGRVAGEYTSRRIALVPPHFGVGFFEVSERLDKLVEYGRRLVEATGHSGSLVNLDFKWDPRVASWKLLDYNARSWRQISLAPLSGVDVLEMLRRDYAGESPLPAGRVRYGRYWLSVKDALLVARGRPKDSPALREYLKILFRPKSFGLLDPFDPRPAVRDLAPIFARRFKRHRRQRP